MKKKELPKYGTGVRGKFVFDKASGKMVPYEKHQKTKTHAVITDEIEPIQSPIDFNKKVFNSKSAYRKHLKANGFYETGGDHLSEKPVEKTEEEEDREYREDIEKSYYDIKYDRIPFTEEQKELFKKEERVWGKNYKIKQPY